MKPNLRSEFLKTMTQLATAGFGLVAALAWNDAIQGLIEKIIGPGNSLVSKVYYAVVVTVVAVIVTYRLGKKAQEVKDQEE